MNGQVHGVEGHVDVQAFYRPGTALVTTATEDAVLTPHQLRTLATVLREVANALEDDEGGAAGADVLARFDPNGERQVYVSDEDERGETVFWPHPDYYTFRSAGGEVTCSEELEGLRSPAFPDVATAHAEAVRIHATAKQDPDATAKRCQELREYLKE